MRASGIPIEDDVADSLPRAQARLARWPSTAKIFLQPTAARSVPATRWCSATSPTRWRRSPATGPRAFYEGAVADKLVAAVRAAGGLMTRDDLTSYQPIEREPVRGSYRGYAIVSMPPSSSGGVILIEILNILEGYPDLANDDARRGCI